MKKFALLFVLLGILTGCTFSPLLLFAGCTNAMAADVEPTVEVPVLMYHHFMEETPEVPSANVCSAAVFREHLTALRDAGYTSVTFADVLAWVDDGVPLPEKPVLLTSDDGYTSVLTVALPLLREFEMTMSVGIIGSMMGRDTGLAHFSLEDWQTAEEAMARLELVSHTWNLHSWNDTEQGVLTPDGGLSDRFAVDVAYMQAIPELHPAVFVYPYGQHSRESEAKLAEMGYRITVTTRDGIARLTGEAPNLTRLPRICVHDGVTGTALLERLTKG